jgi:hypothetical protein
MFGIKLDRYEPVSKYSILFEVKKGENINNRNPLLSSRAVS